MTTNDNRSFVVNDVKYYIKPIKPTTNKKIANLAAII